VLVESQLPSIASACGPLYFTTYAATLSPMKPCSGSTIASTPSAIDIPRRAIGRCRFLTKYQAEIPAMNQDAAIITATNMCTKRMPNDGLKITCTQLIG